MCKRGARHATGQDPTQGARAQGTGASPTKTKGKDQRTATVDRTEKLAEETFKSLESAQQSAIEAVRKLPATE